MSNPVRCINIDWLEVYAIEPPDMPRDPDYYRVHGYDVVQRDYGTRTYNEMFTLRDELGYGFIEIRRSPKQSDVQNAILPFNACHIRLTNRACYYVDAVKRMARFLADHDYFVSRIYRIDLCLDFERFDSGDDPQIFIHRYMRKKYSKINQSEGHGHFADRWDDRHWNSLSWGSPKSCIGTKIYNKTLELKEAHDKPYIKMAWFEAGLIDHPIDMTKKKADGTKYTPVIWRLEFSIRSNVKNWVVIEADGDAKKLRSLRNTFDMYDTPEKLLVMFSNLQEHYFHFRHMREGVLKWKCPRKELFKFKPSNFCVKVEHPASPNRQDTDLMRLRRYLSKYRLVHYDPSIVKAIDTIIVAIDNENMRRYCEKPTSNKQLKALQVAFGLRANGSPVDFCKLLKEIQAELEKGCDIF